MAVEQQSRRLPDPRRHFLDQGRPPVQVRRQAGPSTRRSRTCSANTQGGFSFNGTITGNDFADFLLGYANYYRKLASRTSATGTTCPGRSTSRTTGRSTPRLTLNLGLRWDGIPHTYEEQQPQRTSTPNLYDQANAAVILAERQLSAPPARASAPVPIPILGGLSVLPERHRHRRPERHSRGSGEEPLGNIRSARRLRLSTSTGKARRSSAAASASCTSASRATTCITAAPTFRSAPSVTFNNVSLSNPNVSLLTGQTLVCADHRRRASPASPTPITKRRPAISSASACSAQLASESVLSVSYVGNQNRHQNDYREINQPDASNLVALTIDKSNYNTLVKYPGFNSIKMSEDNQNSHYNGLQMEIHSQLRKGSLPYMLPTPFRGPSTPPPAGMALAICPRSTTPTTLVTTMGRRACKVRTSRSSTSSTRSRS